MTTEKICCDTCTNDLGFHDHCDHGKNSECSLNPESAVNKRHSPEPAKQGKKNEQKKRFYALLNKAISAHEPAKREVCGVGVEKAGPSGETILYCQNPKPCPDHQPQKTEKWEDVLKKTKWCSSECGEFHGLCPDATIPYVRHLLQETEARVLEVLADLSTGANCDKDERNRCAYHDALDDVRAALYKPNT